MSTRPHPQVFTVLVSKHKQPDYGNFLGLINAEILYFLSLKAFLRLSLKSQFKIEFFFVAQQWWFSSWYI